VKEELNDPNRAVATAITSNNDGQMTSVLEHDQLSSKFSDTVVARGHPYSIIQETNSEGMFAGCPCSDIYHNGGS